MAAGPGFTLDVIGAAWHPILEQDAGYADRIEPGGDFLAFELPPEVVVAASRANQHGRARVLLLRGAIDGDGRLRDVGDELGHLDCLGAFLVGLRRKFFLLADGPRLLRRFARPQLHDARLLGAAAAPCRHKRTARIATYRFIIVPFNATHRASLALAGSGFSMRIAVVGKWIARHLMR